MNTQDALDGLDSQLIRRGLPADYARRAIAELADHHQDLVEELRAAGQNESQAAAEAARRLGEPRTLVKKTVGAYQRRHWCGRWPLATFLFGPIVLVALTWLAILLVDLCISWPLLKLGWDLNPQPDGVISTFEFLTARVAQILCFFVGPAFALLVLSHLAKKAAMGSSWVCVGACVLAVFASLFWVGFAKDLTSRLPPDQGMITIGLPFLRFWRDPLYVAQMLLPLGLGGFMVWRMKQLAQRAARLASADSSQGGEYQYAKSA